MNEPINFLSKFKLINDYWSPKVIAELSNYQFKLVKLKGDFVWHKHDEIDEVFIVIHGSMGIEFKDHTIFLNQGEMFIVNRTILHKPFAMNECKVLIIEPKGVINTGDVECDYTSENDVWI